MTNVNHGDGDAPLAGRTGAAPGAPPAAAAITDVDLEDARRALAGAERRARRHLLWAAIGLSPAALVPFLAFLFDGSFGLVVLLLVLVVLIEGWRFLRASSEARRHQVVVDRLIAGHADEP